MQDIFLLLHNDQNCNWEWRGNWTDYSKLTPNAWNTILLKISKGESLPVKALGVKFAPAGDIVLSESTTFTEIPVGKIQLNTGNNAIKIAKNWGWYDIDYIKISPSSNAPTGLIDQAGKEWWRGFYTDSVTFDVATAINNSGSENYNLLIRDIDAIAVQLKKLQDAGVPVLWRPLHEAGGGWFWWGAKGTEPCKKLYLLMYDRLTNYHKLNNLIWVWSTPEADWYPGDQYVDIAGYDSYPQAGDYSPVINTYDRYVSLVNDKKIVAMSENGPIPDPDKLSSYHADWSWFCTWSGFASDGKNNSLEQVKKVYSSDYVITLDELPKIVDITPQPTVTPSATPTLTPSKVPTPTPTVSDNSYDYKVETIFSSQRLVANQMFTAKVTVTNTSSTYYSGTQDVLLIVGLYDKNNTMSNVSYISKGIPYHGVETLSAGFKLPFNVDGYSVRAFVWDCNDLKTTNMIPLSNVTQLP